MTSTTTPTKAGTAEMPEGYRGVRHPEHEGLRGEYELQYRAADGDFQNIAFSHDPAELVTLAHRCTAAARSATEARANG